jgi:two-component sensor histidine kinase
MSRLSRMNLRPRVASGSAEAYGLATLLIAAAALARWGLGFLAEDVLVFAAFYPAVLFAALYGGLGPGTFAAASGGILAWWAFMPHALPLSLGPEINLLTYLVASLTIVWGADHYRKLTRRLSDEEQFRQLALEELGHRLKNKVATIESIVTYHLRNDPKLRAEVSRHLRALGATDELIMNAQGQGACIGDIVSGELRAYEASRASATGPDVLIPPKLALTMAMICHELATNAAKYGALSNGVGRLSVAWTISGQRLKLEWREDGGPAVSRPTRQGFGLRLLSRALDQYNGAVDMTFDPTGLVVQMGLELPDGSIVMSQSQATVPASIPNN